MTPRPYTPRPYQPGMIDFLASVKRKNLWAGMGMGKSLSTLTYLNTAYTVLGDDHPTLILGPLRVARDVWTDEVKKWQHLAGLEVVAAIGDEGFRREALRKDVPIVAINYENLPWLRVQYPGSKWPFKRVVADESTRLKNFRLKGGGVRSGALADIAHTVVEDWINLTGTPSPNGLVDLWGQQWFIDAGSRLGRTFGAFQERFFRPVRNDDGYYDWFPTERTQQHVQERLRDCSLTIDPKDWFDLKEPMVNVIEVDLPKSARQKYKDLEREMFVQLDEMRSVEAFNAAALTMKCLQLANGAMYLDPVRYGPDVAVEVHWAKLEALESIVEEAGGAPVLVAYHFKSDLARIQKAFPDSLNLANAEHLAMAKAGQGKVWLAHPASLGHGVDGLQNHCNIIAFFGHWWDLEQHDQMVERVGPVRQLQAGRDEPVTIHYIIARDTIDEVVHARRKSKRGVQNMLLDYMKGRT